MEQQSPQIQQQQPTINFFDKFLESHNYRSIRVLGQGAFGVVNQICDQNGNNFAVKLINKKTYFDKAKSSIPSEDKQQVQQAVTYYEAMIYNETDCMKMVDSENVLKLVKFDQDERNWYFILEYCEYDLVKYLTQQYYQNPSDLSGLSEDQAFSIFGQIIVGMRAIDSKGFVHRDIKPSNILVTKDGVIKICDFGFAKPLGNARIGKTRLGTHDYKAPEILDNQIYDFKVDIWALGIVLYQLLFRKLPFGQGQYTHSLIIKYCKNTKFDLKLLVDQEQKDSISKQKVESLSPEILDLFSKIFVYDPEYRIDYHGIYYHSALQKYLGSNNSTPRDKRFSFGDKFSPNAPQQQNLLKFNPENGCVTQPSIQKVMEQSGLPQRINIDQNLVQSRFQQQQQQQQQQIQLEDNPPEFSIVIRRNFENQQFVQSQVKNDSIVTFNLNKNGSNINQTQFVSMSQFNNLSNNSKNNQTPPPSQIYQQQQGNYQQQQQEFQAGISELDFNDVSQISQINHLNTQIVRKLPQQFQKIFERYQKEHFKTQFIAQVLHDIKDFDKFNCKYVTIYFLNKLHCYQNHDFLSKLQSQNNFLRIENQLFQQFTENEVYKNLKKDVIQEDNKIKSNLSISFQSAKREMNDTKLLQQNQKQLTDSLVLSQIFEEFTPQSWQTFKTAYRPALQYEFKQLYNNPNYGKNELKIAYRLFLCIKINDIFDDDPTDTNQWKYFNRYLKQNNLKIVSPLQFIEYFNNWINQLSENDILKSINHIYELYFKEC